MFLMFFYYMFFISINSLANYLIAIGFCVDIFFGGEGLVYFLCVLYSVCCLGFLIFVCFSNGDFGLFFFVIINSFCGLFLYFLGV